MEKKGFSKFNVLTKNRDYVQDVVLTKDITHKLVSTDRVKITCILYTLTYFLRKMIPRKSPPVFNTSSKAILNLTY